MEMVLISYIVIELYNYTRVQGYKTVIMGTGHDCGGAKWRNVNDEYWLHYYVTTYHERHERVWY